MIAIYLASILVYVRMENHPTFATRQPAAGKRERFVWTAIRGHFRTSPSFGWCLRWAQMSKPSTPSAPHRCTSSPPSTYLTARRSRRCCSAAGAHLEFRRTNGWTTIDKLAKVDVPLFKYGIPLAQVPRGADERPTWRQISDVRCRGRSKFIFVQRSWHVCFRLIVILLSIRLSLLLSANAGNRFDQIVSVDLILK